MKACSEAIKCMCFYIVIFYISDVLCEKKSCSELRAHRNWPELWRASLTCGRSQSSVVPRVMGGRSAGLAEFPWMALLTYKSCKVRCGGFLITRNHVLTAAHCCDMSWLMEGCKVTGVLLGEHDMESTVDCDGEKCAPKPIHIPLQKFTIHKDYAFSTISHDICLLRLAGSVKLSAYVNPVCLPDECNWKEPDFKWDELKIAGWGFTQDQPKPLQNAVLQTLNMMGTPHSICAPLWMANYEISVIEQNQLCAGMELGKDKCKGDSGGPLMYQSLDRTVAVGIVSFGQNCSHDDSFLLPAVYTRIASFMPWILDNL